MERLEVRNRTDALIFIHNLPERRERRIWQAYDQAMQIARYGTTLEIKPEDEIRLEDLELQHLRPGVEAGGGLDWDEISHSPELLLRREAVFSEVFNTLLERSPSPR